MKPFGRLILCILLIPVAASAQNQRGGLQRPQRDALEAQIFNRFMNKISNDMRLDGPGRNRLTQHLQHTGRERRELAQQTVQLRRRLMQATRDSTTADAEIEVLLQQFAQLRVREQELWIRDQNDLAAILTPRQRAVFVIEWAMFNERIRDLVQQRPPGRAAR